MEASDKNVIDYAAPTDRRSSKRIWPGGMFIALAAILCGWASCLGFDDRITDSEGRDHPQLYVSPFVYPLLALCFMLASVVIIPSAVRVIRERKVINAALIPLLLGVIAIVIPLIGMAKAYWSSLFPLSYRGHGTPGGW